ncbi:protein KINESIN LIGHT CHAIN-RELATED 2-like isoform X1 [Rhodamnia argentea]|uniref:Protein KINESIN LIGHT CHAIN-RELATED 2-like isoform X1 n=1 Tax=Rhodamnia argentea TaxID=178133 RepID=A0A8B8P863_9MYRT|nr:protein KINESIN LIGHT CHAIN-RELATED 2-like isoform X1 [Rhodamnia argentea]
MFSKMPGLATEVGDVHSITDELSSGNNSSYKESYTQLRSPRSPLSPHSPRSDSIDLYINRVVDTSIEQLYNNVFEMQSSDQSPSRSSILSYGEESRLDSELGHLVGDFGVMEMMKDAVPERRLEDKDCDHCPIEGIDLTDGKIEMGSRYKTAVKEEQSSEASSRRKVPYERPPAGKKNEKHAKRTNGSFLRRKQRYPGLLGEKYCNVENILDLGLDDADIGPYLLKRIRDMIATGANPQKALELALRAVSSYEQRVNDKPSLGLVMCLHVLAAIYCDLGQYSEAIPVLERSIGIPALEDGENHALAKFAGCMQLGDTYAMFGQMENSLLLYTAGLEIQKQVLGETDPRVGETCRYMAEAYIQALQFNEAEKLCQMALDIHKGNGSNDVLAEAADRRLMGLICNSKGEYESALEHYVLASMAMASNGQEMDVASIDYSIGDTYLSLAKYDEAVLAYQKALKVFRSTKGKNHPKVASIYVRLANLYHKIGKFKESKSYCESALHIYRRPNPMIPSEEIAGGFIDLSAIYESMNELELALALLKKALKIHADAPGQQNMVAGVEAQVGVIYYMMGKYSDSYTSLNSAVSKFRASVEKKSPLFGIALNQMGLACVQCHAIDEAAELFEEARSILEKEYGPYHPDTLGVCSNLAGTYDALGRLDDAIEILESVVTIRQEKLGTANSDVDAEKQRLAELLKEAGRDWSRKSRPLGTLLDTNSRI